VIAWRQVDRQVPPGEALAHEGHCVGREALVLKEVAGTQERVDLLGLGQLEDARQGLASIGAAATSDFRPCPGERRVEMQVGEMQELHPEGKRIRRP
jgi:hypothetical protein